MTPEQEILADHLKRSKVLAEILVNYRARVRPFIPLSGNPYLLEPTATLTVWAFVKQFELFYDQVGRKLLRSIAAIRGTALRTRDVLTLLEWADKIGLIELQRWRDLAKLHNQLAHEYIVPLGEFDAVINSAWESCDTLFGTHAAILAFVERKSLLEPNHA